MVFKNLELKYTQCNFKLTYLLTYARDGFKSLKLIGNLSKRTIQITLLNSQNADSMRGSFLHLSSFFYFLADLSYLSIKNNTNTKQIPNLSIGE